MGESDVAAVVLSIREEARRRRESDEVDSEGEEEVQHARAAIMQEARRRRAEVRSQQRLSSSVRLNRSLSRPAVSDKCDEHTRQHEAPTPEDCAGDGWSSSEGSGYDSSDATTDDELADLDIAGENWQKKWEENEDSLHEYLAILASDKVLVEVGTKDSAHLQRYVAARQRDLKRSEDTAVFNVVDAAPLYADLYDQLCDAEDTLDGINDIVSGFADHLSGRTREIRILQKQSAKITERIHAREEAALLIEPVMRKTRDINQGWMRQLEAKLTVDAITEGAHWRERQQVQEQEFLKDLRMLDDKLTYLSEDPILTGSALKNDLLPKLASAAERVVPKVTDLLRTKLGELKETSNIKIQQQALAGRAGFAFRFLRAQDRKCAMGMLSEYQEAMQKIYVRNMRRFYETVCRGDAKLAKQELIAKGMTNPKGTPDGSGKKSNLLQGRLGKVEKSLQNRLEEARRKVHGSEATTPELHHRFAALKAMVPMDDHLVVDPSVLTPGIPRTGAETFLQLLAELVNCSLQEASFAAEFFCMKEMDREEMLAAVFEKATGFVEEKAAHALVQGSADLTGCLILLRISESLFTFLLPLPMAPGGRPHHHGNEGEEEEVMQRKGLLTGRAREGQQAAA
eukprot:Hpha_TRINITY_DN2307_c0_g1::TRINITY_DN2307_c0_g1_i1::g.435::m.435/K20298/VPS52; vacuolar protein sorting-associated protein 52